MSVMDLDGRVNLILAHLVQQAQYAPDDYPYESLFIRTELPLKTLANKGTLIVQEDMDADYFPYLQLRTEGGAIQIETCPFGPLALLSSEEDVDVAQVEQVLVESGVTVISPDSLAEMPVWQETSLSNWLFPQRLSDALALFDWLRMHYRANP